MFLFFVYLHQCKSRLGFFPEKSLQLRHVENASPGIGTCIPHLPWTERSEVACHRRTGRTQFRQPWNSRLGRKRERQVMKEGLECSSERSWAERVEFIQHGSNQNVHMLVFCLNNVPVDITYKVHSHSVDRAIVLRCGWMNCASVFLVVRVLFWLICCSVYATILGRHTCSHWSKVEWKVKEGDQCYFLAPFPLSHVKIDCIHYSNIIIYHTSCMTSDFSDWDWSRSGQSPVQEGIWAWPSGEFWALCWWVEYECRWVRFWDKARWEKRE